MTSPFLQQLADYMRTRRYARRTIDTYLHWIRFFILFHKKQHPSQLGNAEVAALFRWIDPKFKLLAQLMYGSGLRLM